jgi:peptide/nickel transport system permease protein
MGPVIVQATLVLAIAIIDAAALSFLGLGSPDDRQPEWGQMLGRSQEFIYDHPHLAVYPAVCIIVVALGFTLMGESMREALDPKTRR